MNEQFDLLYELIDDFFKEEEWYYDTQQDRSLVILESASTEFKWGWLIELTFKKFLLTKKIEDIPIGIKPLIVDLQKKRVIHLDDWPLKSVDELLEGYIKDNAY